MRNQATHEESSRLRAQVEESEINLRNLRKSTDKKDKELGQMRLQLNETQEVVEEIQTQLDESRIHTRDYIQNLEEKDRIVRYFNITILCQKII